jgi:hypothetical protein
MEIPQRSHTGRELTQHAVEAGVEAGVTARRARTEVAFI